jgi:hypothetical protein
LPEITLFWASTDACSLRTSWRAMNVLTSGKPRHATLISQPAAAPDFVLMGPEMAISGAHKLGSPEITGKSSLKPTG